MMTRSIAELRAEKKSIADLIFSGEREQIFEELMSVQAKLFNTDWPQSDPDGYKRQEQLERELRARYFDKTAEWRRWAARYYEIETELRGRYDEEAA